jgi:uncharacterized protein YndB with AHSA1/START domain
MSEKLHHATINFEHFYPAPVERVFTEFADPVARARWSAPSGNDVLIYDEADFREGGHDIFRCGPRDDPKFRGETSYLLIVPNQLVVSSEVLSMDGKRLAIALTTLELEPADAGATLKMTVQMVSFAGPGMVAGYENGNGSALENLARHLSTPG